MNSSSRPSSGLVGLPCWGQDGHVQGGPANVSISEQADSELRPWCDGGMGWPVFWGELLMNWPGFSSGGATAVASELER